MAVTYGFYNALNHDRLYDAIQMSSIFDGIIRDGIFSTIGDTMIVTAPEDGMYVNVGSGRAWFNHTWTLNDTAYPIEAEQAEVVLDRIDAVILEVNSSAEVRANSIKFLKGTPSSNPVKPTLIHNAEVNQYALAYVRIRAGQTTILQSDIENAVGTDETPFITGVLQQVSIETLLKQWDAEFDAWFQRMKDQLSQDAAGNLQLQIDDIEDEKANNDIISDVWNASTTYAVGQYCIYNNSLWKCLVQHSGQTPTEGTYWTKVSVANEITSVNNSLGGLIKTETFDGASVTITSGITTSSSVSTITITIPEGYTIGSITPITRDGAINATVVNYNETTGKITLGYINRYNASVTIKPQVLILFIKS